VANTAARILGYDHYNCATESLRAVVARLLMAALSIGHLAEFGIAQVTDTPGRIPVYCVSALADTGGIARREHGDERDGRDPYG
jgi:hypothetical protein